MIINSTCILEDVLFKLHRIPIEFTQFNNLAYILDTYLKMTHRYPEYFKIVKNKDVNLSLAPWYVTVFDTNLNNKTAKSFSYTPAATLTIEDEICDIDIDIANVCPETYF